MFQTAGRALYALSGGVAAGSLTACCSDFIIRSNFELKLIMKISSPPAETADLASARHGTEGQTTGVRGETLCWPR